MASSIMRKAGLPRGAAPFEPRPWGGYQNLEEGPGYKVKRLVVAPGQRFSLQKHHRRGEHWVVVSGRPLVWINGRARRLAPNDAVHVPRGAWHRCENPGRTPVVLIEVQHGGYLGEDDIVRKQDDYGRVDGAAAARPRTRR